MTRYISEVIQINPLPIRQGQSFGMTKTMSLKCHVCGMGVNDGHTLTPVSHLDDLIFLCDMHPKLVV
ncbi:MAG: hypothetical protein R1F52_06240 [Candidatus Nitrosoabyssus spongiisocia]|nr:MAG: hypothetical protein R1F52_06240 [Nitrosopumilaceae archaeon AB1(1)]